MATRPTSRGIVRSLSTGIVGRLVGGFSFTDSDASTYAAALEGDGVSLSDDQKQAIDTFYATGKSEGWYSDLARVYLPIWQQASANSRCLVSGTQGTFNGGISHNAGYISNPSYSGYFDTGSTSVGKGLSLGAQGYGFLQVDISSSSGSPMGGYDDASGFDNGNVVRQFIGNRMRFEYGEYKSSSYAQSGTQSFGTQRIWASWENGGDIFLDDRTSSGYNNIAYSSGVVADEPSSYANDYLMAENAYSGSAGADRYWGGEMGAAFFHTSSDSSFNADFTLALKNLWEGCTGLSL